MAYQRPMVTVDQNFTITPTSIDRDQPAFIFGPNYELHRYENADEKLKTAIGTFDAFKYNKNNGSMWAAYPYVINAEAVDKSYTKLFGDNVVVKLCELDEADLIEAGDSEDLKKMRNKSGGYTKLLFKNKAYLNYDESGNDVIRDQVEVYSHHSVQLPANLATGDTLLVSYYEKGADVPQRILSDIVTAGYKSTPWDITPDNGSSCPAEGAAGTLVVIEDAIPESVDTTRPIEVMLVVVKNGVEFTRKNLTEFYRGDLTPDPRWQWEQPDEEHEIDGKLTFGIKINQLGVLVADYFFPDEYCDVLYADLYVTYRELVTSYSDTFHSLVGASEVENVLGTVDPDNPLAMGVYMAALNSATDDGDEAPPVYFMAVPEDNKNGYAAVLNKASITDRAYVFAPTTRDEGVLKLVRSHVLEMSTKTVKMWRIAAASAIIPDEVARLSAADNVQGRNWLAIPIQKDGSTEPEDDDYKFDKLRVVTSTQNINGNTDTAFRSTLVVGDIVRFGYYTNAWGELDYDEYVIAKIINNYTVQIRPKDGKFINVRHLENLLGAENYVPSRIEIYHPYTSRESAEVAASVSKAMATRRMLNVFPGVFRNDGVTITGEFAACAVAGLVSATEPQQPITNMTIRGIDDVPTVYQTYNSAELDLIASGGTFIIMQDMSGDRVYVRHQITTAYPDGNINTAELSITKNVDHISYAFAEAFRPYYGRYNITEDLLATFNNLATDLIDQFAGVNSVYGPQLIAENSEVQYIRNNELLKDHVDIGIKLGVPYPCNNIDIVLTI